MSKKFETDEDAMIYRLEVHKNQIGWVIEELKKQGIPCERTKGMDAKGDILIVNEADEPRVKQVVREIQNRYNG